MLTAALVADHEAAGTVRTTTAVTVIEGGVKANVLPAEARALTNHRINYGDTIEGVIAHVREVIDDPRVEVRELRGDEVSRLSDPSDPSFTTLARALREVHPEVVVVPSLFVAATDARDYEGISANIYRLSLFFVTSEDAPRYHGVDERISRDDYAAMIQVYGRLLRS